MKYLAPLFMGAALLLVALSMAGGVLILLGSDQLDIGGDIARYSIGTLIFLAGPTILAGLWLGSRKPGLGAACQVGGATIFGICFSWTIIGPVLAVLVATLGVRRARRQARARRMA